MLSLFEPSQQLTAALVIGTCTLCAALVNAVAQLRIARETRRNPRKAETTAPPPRPRVRRWVVASAALALALGWSATERVQASAVPGTRVLSMLTQDGAGSPSTGGLAVALVRFRAALDDSTLADFLQRRELRPYAVDFRLAEDEPHWHPVSVATAPGGWTANLRAAGGRSALHQACALDALTVDASPDADSLALALVRAHADAARARADRFASGEPMSHGVRVIGTSAALIDLTSDPFVADAQLWRWDPAALSAVAAGDSLSIERDGCEVVRLDAQHNPLPDQGGQRS